MAIARSHDVDQGWNRTKEEMFCRYILISPTLMRANIVRRNHSEAASPVAGNVPPCRYRIFAYLRYFTIHVAQK